ncbi:MAG: hypothetical protein ABJN84_01510 [Flavobacteriaceae bacterium]
MKYKGILVLALSIVLLFSCKDKSKAIPHGKSDSENPSAVEKKAANQGKREWLNFDIDVNNIKENIDSFTSSYSSRGGSIFDETDLKEDDYIGLYYLVVNSEDNIPDVVVGKMIIYNSEKPWVFENRTDNFLEISLWKKGITLFDGSIEVEANKNALIELLGDEYSIIGNNNDIIVYKGKRLIGFFKIESGKITYIKIGRYVDGTDYNIIIDKMNEY